MPNIKVLAKRWITAKDMIKSLQEELLSIENELLPLVDSSEGGSKTSHLEGYKLTIKRPINRCFDLGQWAVVCAQIPQDLWPVETKTVLDEKGCVWLKQNNPDLWKLASQAITEKPGKPGFTIEAEVAQ